MPCPWRFLEEMGFPRTRSASEEGALLAIAQAERFAPEDQGNVYGSRYMAHFKSLRVFPSGLR